MAAVKRSVSMQGELLDEIDEARGDVPFSAWVSKACAARLRGRADGSAGAAPAGVQAVTEQVRAADRIHRSAPSSAAAKANVAPRPKGGGR